MKKIRHLLTGLACLLCFEATAHWHWLDKDGRKVFSDRAPPPEIPEKDILERPAPVLTVAVPQNGASGPKLGAVDKDLTERKKKGEEAETARRKAEDEKISKARAENCERARRAKASFDSGRPIARSNEKGEPEILDAKTRSAEIARLQSIIDSDCN
ncbi:MAG: DUF4124 domain-containing protein [Rhodoferax sp.]